MIDLKKLAEEIFKQSSGYSIQDSQFYECHESNLKDLKFIEKALQKVRDETIEECAQITINSPLKNAETWVLIFGADKATEFAKELLQAHTKQILSLKSKERSEE